MMGRGSNIEDVLVKVTATVAAAMTTVMTIKSRTMEVVVAGVVTITVIATTTTIAIRNFSIAIDDW
jgi:hypothetical protein